MEGKRREKKNMDKDPEEGQCSESRRARGESRVEKEESAHCVALTKARRGRHWKRTVTKASLVPLEAQQMMGSSQDAKG